MSRHTTFEVGGPADFFVTPSDAKGVAHAVEAAISTGVPWRVMGQGSNLLVADAGVRGLVICLKDCLDGMEQTDGEHIFVAAGVTMARAAMFAANLGLSGLEFAHGIPGTVGGGVYMNAGAYGGEICQVCTRVEVMDMSGERHVFSGEEMKFSYRHSRLEEEAAIVLSAVFRLAPKPEEQIRELMRDLMTRRRNSQPLDLPSAGSAFKRPVGGYAAALIDQTGLKGYRVGGAAVSEKHAGFVVNLGGATANDVKALLTDVSSKVYERTGIRLEPEVRIW
jgi:UDP-N-acetylmuramate dehydrogenase